MRATCAKVFARFCVTLGIICGCCAPFGQSVWIPMTFVRRAIFGLLIKRKRIVTRLSALRQDDD